MRNYEIEFKKSTRDGKRYMVVFYLDGSRIKTTHFGSDVHDNFTIHRDEERKKRYLDRHRAREDWSAFMSAGALSRWILWNKPTIDASLKDYMKRFKLKLKSN
mgnify:CR=1 FL=1